MGNLAEELSSTYILIACEGGAEDAIVRMLLDEGAFCFDKSRLIDVTRLRTASDIERQYLGYEYDLPVALLYVTDSLRSRFALSPLYRSACTVYRICTRPEIEMLVIINEGCYGDFARSRMKPSIYCKQKLGMRNVKRPEEVRRYWTVEKLRAAIAEYGRLHHFEKGELSFAQLIG